MAERLEVAPGERVLVELRFQTGGFLKFLLGLLGPLLKASPTAAAWVTDRRVVKRVAGRPDLELPLARIATAYFNTSSGSFALAADPEDQGLLLELVENGREVAAALAGAGVKVEEESLSPRRRALR